MENYIAERNQLRRLFDKSCKNLDVLLASKETSGHELLAQLRNLEDKSDRLFRADDNVRDHIFANNTDEAEIEKEFDEVEFYREELIKYKSKCEFIMKTSTITDDKASSNERHKRNFRLPKLELKKFDGNVKNWIGFWAQFSKIHDDEDINKEDKFQYLIQATEEGSAARQLIDSFPPSGKNYAKAIDQLKSRFARDEFLVEVYVRELLTLVLKQATSSETGMSLSSLYDKLETQLRALESLGVTREKYAAMLFPLVESALPNELLKVWERHRHSHEKKPGNEPFLCTDNLSMLLDFLKSEVEAEERIHLAQTSFGAERKTSSNVLRRGKRESRDEQEKRGELELYTAQALYSANSEKDGKFGKKFPVCIFCSNTHASQDCLKAQKLSLEEKKTCIMNKKGCFACLKLHHTIRHCRAFVKCLICSRKHFPIMCPDLYVMKESKSENKTDKNDDRVQNSLSNTNTSQVLLQTIVVKLLHNNKQKVVRALLDSGSQKSYILSSCAHDLMLNKIGQENIIQGVFGGQCSAPKIHGIFEVVIANLNSTYKRNITVLDQTKICNFIPRLSNVSFLNDLKMENIVINDCNFDKNASDDIELLLGADVFGHLLTGKIKNLHNGLVAVETYLGWTIMGEYTNEVSSFNVFSGFTDYSITDLWNLDVLGITDQTEIQLKKDVEHKIVEFFNRTIIRNVENRYEIQLPMVQGYPSLLSNKELAHKRLLVVTENLMKKGIFEDYQKVLVEWENLGIIEEVRDSENISGMIHYLPHHAVVKEASITTKIRPVFDASAKDVQGNCLNDCLEKGPNLIELIPTILLNFRKGAIGVIADIEKAFLQISIAPKDRDCVRFFWWENYAEKKLKIYRHCRVVFGVKSSPFLLAATLRYHLSQAPENFKDTAKLLQKALYVDNCVSSVSNENKLQQFIEESKYLMSSGKFNLRGWVYNTNLQASSLEIDNITSVLGLNWNIRYDTIQCEINALDQLKDTPKTKRGLLSAAQKIFDPIGFSSPVTLIPKLLLQDTWKLKIGWDKELPIEIMKQFESWLKQIHFISLCRIPRMISTTSLENSEHSTLHVFCDASKLAYSTCIFLRSAVDNNVSISLIQAKSRVAPQKNLTLPRLELLSALIGSRLCRTIKQVDEFKTMKTYYWSDSMVVLAWIRTKGNWTTFVRNRVNEINSCSDVHDWNHVPGKLNPADIGSRGCNSKTLLTTKWWEGPQWLKKNPEEWPYCEINPSENEVNLERKKNAISTFTMEVTRSIDLNYFSKFSKIVRMVGWIFRFYSNSKSNLQKKSGYLNIDEIRMAEIHVWKIVQKECFGEKTVFFKNFSIFKDEWGIWRLKTKLLLGDYPEDFRCPILLPNKSSIVAKMIYEQHCIHHHVGVQTLLCRLRETYWILKGRKTVKGIIEKCVICRRYNSKTVQTTSAPLPPDRITCNAAFKVTGVDLAGPLYLKEGGKAWIVLFTCAVYRAVHLEIVKSASTDSFLLALRRFIARRGRISTIYSDNGTNFVGASNQLKKLDWKKIVDCSTENKIKWIFNPPTASWWGGWWERIIRIIKELLRRNLGKLCLTYEEITTVLCDCEAIINARPLTYISEDQNDLVPLSPSLFIQDITNTATPDLDNIDKNHFVRRIRYLQKIRDGLRLRFQKEYLAELINTGRSKTHNQLKVGDIVFIGADNMKRLNWPLGRVLEIYPGRDGVPRVAKLKTQHGELTRPYQRLYPMEVASDQERSELHGERIQRSEDDAKPTNIQDENELKKKKKEVEEREFKSDVTTTRSGRLVKCPKRYQSHS